MDKKTTVLENLFCGATAGAVTRLVVSPFDVVKIRMQVQAEPISSRQLTGGGYAKYQGFRHTLITIVQEEGVGGLWRGNVAAEALYLCYTPLQFASYNAIKQYVVARDGEFPAHYSSLCGGASAIVATGFTYPFDLTRTRMAAQGVPKVFPNMRALIHHVLRTDGPLGFYKGLTPSLIQIVPYMGVQFSLYERLSKITSKYTTMNSSLVSMAVGAAAGTTAKFVVMPLDFTKKRLQFQDVQRDAKYGEVKHYTGTVDCIVKTLRSEGPLAFYKGTVASLMKVAPGAAVTFGVYDLACSWVHRGRT